MDGLMEISRAAAAAAAAGIPIISDLPLATTVVAAVSTKYSRPPSFLISVPRSYAVLNSFGIMYLWGEDRIGLQPTCPCP
jgi:hypothetical protein